MLYEKGEKLLYEACEIYAKTVLEKIPESEEIAKIHIFSTRFRQNMALILQGKLEDYRKQQGNKYEEY